MRSSMMTAMSSAGLRDPLTTDGAADRTDSDSACLPRRPSTTPNSTLVPGLRAATPAGRVETCTNTSSPSSDVMKPKPFSESYHLTVPVGTTASLTHRHGRRGSRRPARAFPRPNRLPSLTRGSGTCPERLSP